MFLNLTPTHYLSRATTSWCHSCPERFFSKFCKTSKFYFPLSCFSKLGNIWTNTAQNYIINFILLCSLQSTDYTPHQCTCQYPTTKTPCTDVADNYMFTSFNLVFTLWISSAHLNHEVSFRCCRIIASQFQEAHKIPFHNIHLSLVTNECPCKTKRWKWYYLIRMRVYRRESHGSHESLQLHKQQLKIFLIHDYNHLTFRMLPIGHFQRQAYKGKLLMWRLASEVRDRSSKSLLAQTTSYLLVSFH